MEGGNLRGEVSLCGMYVLNFYNLTGKEERRQVPGALHFEESFDSNQLHSSLFACPSCCILPKACLL